ncbi:hypothetical protein KAJ27_19740 [bacterium]|nr:hypothetical protein [bacterium]
MINKKYITINTALRKSQMPSPMFACRYSVSPYVACQHACKYCDGRAEKYYVEGDFEKDIKIRKNLCSVLESNIKNIREPGIISIGSGVSDPYQPVEEEESLMRGVAEIIQTSSLGAAVLTKSSLVLRDLKLWEKVHKNSSFILMVSLTSIDCETMELIEPGASNTKKRLDAIKQYKDKKMYVGVLAMPFLPFITDGEESIGKLGSALKSIGVDFVIPGGLTLRPGCQKETYFEMISRNFPDLIDKYKDLYCENRQSGSPKRDYSQLLNKRVNRIFSDLEIPMEIPHYIYKNSFPLYDEIYILLHHMVSLYSNRGIDIGALKKGVSGYSKWLYNSRKSFNRNRRESYKTFENKFKQFIISKDFYKIIDNRKLREFIIQVVIDKREFNYNILKLI